jgi:RNA polymerase primary sigma factor
VTIEDKAQQIRQLVIGGKMRGYVLYDEIDELVPAGGKRKGGPVLDEILSQLAANGIEVLEEPGAEQESRTDDESLDDNELQELSDQAGDTPVTMYLREVMATPHLTQEREIELAKRISDGGQNAEEAEKQLMEPNLRLVVKIARRYRNKGLGLLDLFQEGNIGLMEAVKQFNYTRGYKFSTCAIFWIRRAIRVSLLRDLHEGDCT